MDKYIIIGQALVCMALLIIIICQKARADKDCKVLLEALEEEQLLRAVERAVTNIMIQNRDRNIEMLKKCVEEAVKKAKDLETRLWEEAELK